MLVDIIEAIEEYYNDDDFETAAQCLMWLSKSLGENISKKPIYSSLSDHDRCILCGGKLKLYTYNEYHDEVDATEVLSDVVCPNCNTI